MALYSTQGGLQSPLQIFRPSNMVSLGILLILLGACSGGGESTEGESEDGAAASAELQLGDGTESVTVEDEEDTSMFALSVPDKPEPTPEPTPAPAKSQGTTTTKHDPGLGREGGVTLSGTQIKAAISSKMGQVKACYERELKKDDRLAGKVMVSFTIGADGKVRRASVGSNTTGNRTLGNCILIRLRQWRFPTAESPADVVYPFTFKPRDF